MKKRILNGNDADAYQKIRLEGLKNSPEAFGSSYEEEQLYPIDLYKSRLESDTAFTFGVFEKEELAGVVTLVKETKVKLKHKASIYAMYVSPDYRGRGIGKKLMAEVVKKAQAFDDTEQLHLSVVSTNPLAKQLYTSFGFTVYGHEKRALKADGIYYDEDHMVLFL
jgi:ribosomal protein S18 acetylase RimI-like enzyme